MYVVSIVAYQDRCKTSREDWIFTHVGLSAHACAQYIVHEVDIHRWLLSGIEEWTILNGLYTSLLFFYSSKRFGARLTHRLNRKFLRTDDTIIIYLSQDSATK